MNENPGDMFEEMLRKEARKNQPELPRSEVEATIARNIQLLYDFFVKEQNDTFECGMWYGVRIPGPVDRSILVEEIKITYNARTGQIAFPHGAHDDESFRIFRTHFLTMDTVTDADQGERARSRATDSKYFAIRIVSAEGDVNAEDAMEATTQSGSYEDEDELLQVKPADRSPSDRWIKPEKVFPGYSWLLMQSQFVQRYEFLQGDIVFFDSLEEFNRRYWVPAEQELFKKTGKKVTVISPDADPNQKPPFWRKIRSLFGF